MCFSNEEIIEYGRSQNNHLLRNVNEAQTTLRVRYRKRARNSQECHPVLEVTPEVWKTFINAGKIHIGFSRCLVEDQSPLVQCTKCLGYGHTTALCKTEKDTCSYCSGENTRRSCPSRTKAETPTCANCVRAHREGADLAYTAYSEDCQERKKWDNIARSRVSYC